MLKLFLLAAALQAPTDSAHLKTVKARLDSIRVQEDSLRREACRGGTLSASGACSGSNVAPRKEYIRRFTNRITLYRAHVDSIERASVAVPPPAAVYTVTLAGTPTDCDTVNMTLYPNGHWCRSVATVRDNNGNLQTITSANLTWTVTGDSSAVTHVRNGPDRYEVHSPTRSGFVILTARWVDGSSVSKRITLIGPSAPPPIDTTTPPIPPPDPIVLPAPSALAPGATSAPGPEVATLTPTFTWSAVSGATGYVVAIRDVASNTIVYPSSTGVGVPIAGTSLTLPAGMLLAGKSYAWDVTAVNATGKSPASANRYFTTAAATAPSGIAAAELPRAVPEHRDPYPGRACSVRVSTSMSLNAALGAARGGQVVCLAVGTFERPVIPARAAGDTGWIVIRTDTVLPPEGIRMRPSMAAALNLAKIVTTLNGAPALTTTPGTFGWFFRGIEVTAGPAVTTLNAIMQLGTSGAAQDTDAEVPQGIVLSQVYLHGTSLTDFQRCLYLQSGSTAVVDSWLSECHGKGKDSQAIGSFNGPGPFLIRNNYLEGAGENVLFGGATPSIPGMVAADITFQRNHVYTPVSWKGVWTKKNLFELKNSVRVLIEENVFDGSWTDGQIGHALLFKSINDQGTCNWCRTTDVTVRRSLVKNAGGGITFSGAENYNSFGTVDSIAKRFRIEDVVFDNLNVAPYSGAGRGIQITGGTSDVVFDRTVIAGSLVVTMVVDNNKPSLRTSFANSVWAHGTYFASGNGVGVGLSAMTAGLPGFLWTDMTVVKVGATNTLPPGTTVVPAESQAALAAQIRATVSAAVAGVVLPP